MTELTHPLATVPPQDELLTRAEADPPLRPRFHFVSPAGWLNDPNGVSQWNGTYHLFYQYNPEGAFHHRIQWGHATSTDLVTWTDLPVALEPSAGPDADGCWSGGVLVNDGGTPTLVYSGRFEGNELPCVAAGSPDLQNWTKDPGNPVIAAPPAGVEITAYRDHCVWREGTKWRQLVGGSGIRHRGGTAFLYESSDLRSWDYIGPLCIGDASQGDPADTDWTGTMWECVDLFRAGQGSLGSAPTDNSPDVLVFSAWDDGVTRHPLYWTGRYAGGDAFEPEALHRLDYGGRFFYAPQSFEDESGRRVMFGWMQEGRSDAAMVEAGWSGVMSSHGSPPWPTMEPWSLRRFPKLRSCAETTSPSPARCWQGGLERPLRPVHPQPGGPGAGPAACAWCGGSAGSADVSGRCRGDRDSAESGRRWHPRRHSALGSYPQQPRPCRRCGGQVRPRSHDGRSGSPSRGGGPVRRRDFCQRQAPHGPCLPDPGRRARDIGRYRRFGAAPYFRCLDHGRDF